MFHKIKDPLVCLSAYADRNLKIKVSDGSGNWVIELEGGEEVVTREFEKIKATGLGKISHPGSVIKVEEDRDSTS